MKTTIETFKSKLANGVSPAMATPLEADGYTVNTAVIPQLVDLLLAAGVKGLFVGGTTGEGILLTATERQRLHAAAVTAVDGRVPVLLHVGANRLDETLALARHAAAIGADAIAAVTPFFYGVHDLALVTYYQAISVAVPEMPLLLYDIPHLAINGITPEALPRLHEAVPSLVGMKTSRPDVQMVRRLLDAAPDPFLVLAGNESAALGLLALGADGLISGLSTAVPEPFVALTRAYGDGDLATARQQQQLINELLPHLPAGARIGAIKQILTERGIEAGTAVPPRPMPKEPIWAKMKLVLDEHRKI